MKTLDYSSRYRKDRRLAISQGRDMCLLDTVIDLLLTEQSVQAYGDHELEGNWLSYRELHIKPDWLLVYAYSADNSTIKLARTGSHSHIFG